jgi:hypothetical protein
MKEMRRFYALFFFHDIDYDLRKFDFYITNRTI